MRSKRGMSEIIGYVLLVVIGLSLSVLVYGWLKGYIIKPGVSCDEGVSISIRDYACLSNNNINITFENNGRFNIPGVIVRAAYTPEGKAIYETKLNYFPNDNLIPGEYVSQNFTFNSTISKIEIQPFSNPDKKVVLCPGIITQLISCS